MTEQSEPESVARRETYDVHAVEAKWLPVWEQLDPFRADDDSPREKRYALTMFPYPSGDLHMGHAEVTALHDVVARHWWQRGYEVLNPMGWDSFGLNAENAAIRNNEHPATYTYANIDTQFASFKKYGVAVDWSRRFNTSDPEYYRWTQWLFLRFRERGLAYRKNSPVNWCPNDQTVLANEQVVDGRCERCGAEVTKRELTQWYFKITDYAQELLDNLDDLAPTWPDRVITAQRNWIGRSEGAHVDFPVVGADEARTIQVYTTRPDTLFGATFMVVAADAALARELVTAAQRPAFEAYLDEVRKSSEIDRMSTDRPKSGVFLGVHVRNPANDAEIPVYAADYVLPDYGTGAIMAVPGQDQRDWDFAKVFDLPVVRTVQPPEDWDGEAYTGAGPAIASSNSEVDLNGRTVDDAKAAIIDWLEQKGFGTRAVNFRLRDWLLSRQRYWGAPIPIVHCQRCGEVAVPDDQLPVVLPDLRGADLTPKGVSPLAAAAEWVEVDCPQCGGPARRDADTMDTFVDSSWYFLRYCSPHDDAQAFDPDLVERLGPVRHLRRRRGARGAAPAVRPVLHHGPERHGHGGLPRAVLGAAEPGHRHQPGQEDEQVAGQRRQSGGPTIGLRRGCGAADPGVRRPARGRHRLGRHVARRVAALPAAGVAAERRRRVPGGHTRRRWRRRPARRHAQDGARGGRAVGGAALQRRDRAGHGAGQRHAQGDRHRTWRGRPGRARGRPRRSRSCCRWWRRTPPRRCGSDWVTSPPSPGSRGPRSTPPCWWRTRSPPWSRCRARCAAAWRCHRRCPRTTCAQRPWRTPRSSARWTDARCAPSSCGRRSWSTW